MNPLSPILSPHRVNLASPRFGTTSPFAELDKKLDEYDTPAFQARLTLQFERAKAHITQQLLVQKKPGFVILDVDETVIDNREFYRDPQAKYFRNTQGKDYWTAWDGWLKEARAPAIPQAKAFIDWMELNHVPYAYVTGRLQEQEQMTRDNLNKERLIGPNHCLGVFCKPNEWWVGTTGSQKILMRQEVEKKFGMPIIASLGDMPTDMTGISERDYLLPTSEYYPKSRVIPPSV